jgi:propionyl-CoA carboxylase alpha chain
VSQPQRTVFAAADEEHVVEWYGGRDGYSSRDGDVRVVSAAPHCVTIEVDRISTRVDIAVGEASPTGARHVEVDSRMGSLHLRVVPRFVDPADVVTPGSLLAPMPGTVIGVPLEAGAEVTAGQTVLVLEAMKMQHTISAPTDGVLSELAVAMGQQVSAGEVLAVVTDPELADSEQADPEQADPEGDPS